MNASLTPLSLDQVADHLERMLLRYEELQRSNALLQAQLLELAQERDALRARLAAARARVDTLLARIPADAPAEAAEPAAAGAGALADQPANAPETRTSAVLAAWAERQTRHEAGVVPFAKGEDNT